MQNLLALLNPTAPSALRVSFIIRILELYIIVKAGNKKHVVIKCEAASGGGRRAHIPWKIRALHTEQTRWRRNLLLFKASQLSHLMAFTFINLLHEFLQLCL